VHVAEQSSPRVAARPDERTDEDLPDTAQTEEVDVAALQARDTAPDITERQAGEIQTPADGTRQSAQHGSDAVTPELGGSEHLEERERR